MHAGKCTHIYLVTEGDLRMTDSRTLDRGGMSSTDSEMITSSGWVIFKNESAAAFISGMLLTDKWCVRPRLLLIPSEVNVSFLQ